MFTKDESPITVVVNHGRWDAFGPTTPRSEFLFQVLRQQGGIADSVPDGKYEYNVRTRRLRFVASLTPIKD